MTSRNKKNDNEKSYWETQWSDMPEYVSEKQKVFAQIDFEFDNNLEFASKMLCQNITDKTKSVWYPKKQKGEHTQYRVVGGSSDTRYPIYIVSKNRHDKCYTSRFLTQMEVKHYVVVEPDEVELYKKTVENKFCTVLELDMSYKDNYDVFDNLGDSKPKGPGGARNFCWEHSIKNGFKWHWMIMQ